ncbi:hypothetical protein RHMOL_Rhmol08G0127300 [Rhododendron molle]|uniref:Uncharacterized protein n=1 Tax=Rhododendron molle TaxID=49168 RepID=A0ACC0MP08_RHOML|nr:hypothetical protein RHMOL_Rhmol08G0127300 [Rhododendron molle]
MVSKSRRRQSGDDGSNRSSYHEVKVKAAPHFFKIIHSSVVPHQKLRMPLKFISQYGNNLGNNVFLKVPSGAVWKVELERSNGVVWMCNGWKEFAKYYSIGFGHLLVFRYDGNCNFNVLIFDTSASEIEYPASYYRANIDKDASVKILDDSLVRESPVSERERANTKSKGLKLPNRKKDVKTEIETEEGAGGTSIGQRRHQSQIPVKMLSATADMNSRALERARDFKSKKPFFTVHMQPSYISGKFCLSMPVNFVKKYLGDHHKNFSLKISDGTIWSVRSYRRSMSTRCRLAWRQFARDNNLKVGDICIFELMIRQIHPQNMVSKSRRRQSGDNGSYRSSSHEVKVKAAPHFFKIIHSSGVPHQKLRMPLKFISQYGNNLGNNVFLKVPSGAVWKVELERSNGVVWMCNGWKEFAKYYSIGFGHLLVFRKIHPQNMVSKSRRRQSGDDGSNRSSSHEMKVKAAPHFFKIIHSSGVPHQKLRIPLKFISQYGKNVGNHVFLKVPSGAVWKVELERSSDVVWMRNGWKEFAKYYSIGYGHLLVFRYDGNCNFNVLIFDTSASEIEYPVSATHGEQTNINGNGNSKIPDTEDVIENDDSVETLGDTPRATYNTKREEIYGRGEIEKLGIQTRQKTRQASYYRANIEKDVSVKILDDSLVRVSPVSERERANTNSGMENNSNKQEFPPNFKSKGLKLSNQKKDAKTEIETEECTGGTSVGERRHRSQVAVQKLSATTNINSRALERARDFKSKKPFFTVHLQPSYVSCNYSMNVPLEFLKEYLRDNQKNISLRISDGTTWLVRLYAGAMNGKRNLGWGPFVRDNNLKVGDICVFELISTGTEPQLDVTIIRK